MKLSIDPSSADPLFDQIARGLKRALTTGALGPGDRLPTARDLADSLQVNLHTVLRAYAILRDEGLLEVRRGRGTVVVARAKMLGDARLHRAVANVVSEARRVGLEENELLRLVSDGFRERTEI
ncbi:GntR family transcriptional regulator [Nonomuraea sp. NN258]|uniref:GntR family transcriptional regulator n=1 Tax=Nonomuraea antri TaxID=2730852 RepID=UPI00156845CC|nr:GntR family transcriptional regulator [Nonomuraea antri]NRQ31655.1 GntR family transcriptional regulator [Nonomuraea antri]